MWFGEAGSKVLPLPPGGPSLMSLVGEGGIPGLGVVKFYFLGKLCGLFTFKALSRHQIFVDFFVFLTVDVYHPMFPLLQLIRVFHNNRVLYLIYSFFLSFLLLLFLSIFLSNKFYSV